MWEVSQLPYPSEPWSSPPRESWGGSTPPITTSLGYAIKFIVKCINVNIVPPSPMALGKALNITSTFSKTLPRESTFWAYPTIIPAKTMLIGRNRGPGKTGACHRDHMFCGILHTVAKCYLNVCSWHVSSFTGPNFVFNFSIENHVTNGQKMKPFSNSVTRFEATYVEYSSKLEEHLNRFQEIQIVLETRSFKSYLISSWNHWLIWDLLTFYYQLKSCTDHVLGQIPSVSYSIVLGVNSRHVSVKNDCTTCVIRWSQWVTMMAPPFINIDYVQGVHMQ